MFNLKPNVLRILFDSFVLIYGTLLIVIFKNFDYETALKFLITNPIPFLLILMLSGLYGRNKFASVRYKVSIFIFTAVVILASNLFLDIKISLEFNLLTLPLLILARIFLNINNRFQRVQSMLSSSSNRVLIIGGAGYIGTHLVRELLSNGFYVRILDKFMFGQDSIKEFRLNKNFEMIEGDATNVLTLANSVRGMDSVVHLAGLVGDPACAVDNDFTIHTNIVSARMAKDMAISAGVKRFIFASSCSVYGLNENLVDETSELNPVSLYAKTKISTEQELLKLSRDDFHVTILRFSTVFGHSNRQRFDLVGNLFTAQAFTSGELTVIGADQWRPFVHVKDLARAVRYVLNAPINKVSGEIFNVGDDSLNRTILGLAEELQKAFKDIFNKDLSIKIIEMAASDKRNYKVSFSKIAKELKFKCETNFYDGFCEMLNNFDKNSYGDFKAPIYSNVLITKDSLNIFNDESSNIGLYTALKIK